MGGFLRRWSVGVVEAELMSCANGYMLVPIEYSSSTPLPFLLFIY